MIRLREVGWRYRLEDGHFYFDKDEVDRSASKYMKNPNYSAIGWVFLHKQPLLRGDISKERRFESDRRLIEKGVISQLIIPVVVNNEVIGLFNFHSRKANCFDRGHLELAQPVVNTIALTVKQFQTRQEMEAIHEITTAIQESLKLDEILKKILEHIRLQGYDRVRIYLYDEMQKELIGALQVGSLHYRGFEGVRLPIEEDVYSQRTFEAKNVQIYHPRTIEEGMPTGTLEEVLIEEQLKGQEQMIKRGWEWAEFPLIVVEEGQDRIVGKISLDNAISKRPLQQERLERLMAYASQAAVAIRHAQLHQQMVEQVEIRTTELNKMNEQFLQLAEHIREVFWMTSVEKDEMLYVSPGYEEIWGRTCESLYASSLTWAESIHPEDRDRILHAAKTKQVRGEYDEEYRIVRPAGSIRWIQP